MSCALPAHPATGRWDPKKLPLMCRLDDIADSLRFWHAPAEQSFQVTGFEYRDQRDNKIVGVEMFQRIKKLAIPPAWSDVWISPDPMGSIQPTGFE